MTAIRSLLKIPLCSNLLRAASQTFPAATVKATTIHSSKSSGDSMPQSARQARGLSTRSSSMGCDNLRSSTPSSRAIKPEAGSMFQHLKRSSDRSRGMPVASACPASMNKFKSRESLGGACFLSYLPYTIEQLELANSWRCGGRENIEAHMLRRCARKDIYFLVFDRGADVNRFPPDTLQNLDRILLYLLPVD